MKPAIPFDRFASDHFHPSANNNLLVNEIYALAVSSSTYGNPSCVMVVRNIKHWKYFEFLWYRYGMYVMFINNPTSNKWN